MSASYEYGGNTIDELAIAATQLKEQGNQHLSNSKYALAAEKYTQAIELFPTAILHSNRAQALIKIESYGLAIQDANTAIRIDPTYMKAYYRRASANYALGKLKDALRDFEAVLRIVPTDIDALQKLKECKKEINAEQFNRAIISMRESVLGICLGHSQVDSMVVVDSYDGPRLLDIAPKNSKNSKNGQQLNREKKDTKEGKDVKDKKSPLKRGDSGTTDKEDDSCSSGDELGNNSDDSLDSHDNNDNKTKNVLKNTKDDRSNNCTKRSSSSSNNLEGCVENDENEDDDEDDDEDGVEDEVNDDCDSKDEEENGCLVTMDFIAKMIVCFESQKKLHVKYVCKILLLAIDHFKEQPSLLRLTLPVLKNGNDNSENVEETNNSNHNQVKKEKKEKKGKRGKRGEKEKKEKKEKENTGRTVKNDAKDEKDKINKIEKRGSFTICGDTHGQFFDLCHIFQINGFPSEQNPYLFNGDFVDRGSFSFETVFTLLAIKIACPKALYLLRGNHETKSMNRIYGFHGEVDYKYNINVMNLFSQVFNWLPIAAVISNNDSAERLSVFVVHGGLSTNVAPDKTGVNSGKWNNRRIVNNIGGSGGKWCNGAGNKWGPSTASNGLSGSGDGGAVGAISLEEIEGIVRGKEPTDQGLMADLLWSDPHPLPGRVMSTRGVGFSFGPDYTAAFLEKNNLQLMVRSHEMKEEGYIVEHDGKCITVFSAPNYCDQMGNKGAFVRFFEDMKPVFTTFGWSPHPDIPPMRYAGNMFGL